MNASKSSWQGCKRDRHSKPTGPQGRWQDKKDIQDTAPTPTNLSSFSCLAVLTAHVFCLREDRECLEGVKDSQWPFPALVPIRNQPVGAGGGNTQAASISLTPPLQRTETSPGGKTGANTRIRNSGQMSSPSRGSVSLVTYSLLPSYGPC